MATFTCHFHPKGLGINTGFNITIPTYDDCDLPKYSNYTDYYNSIGKLPVLWLFHGGSDFYGDWLNKSTVEVEATKRKLAVVMPDAQNSSYTDMAYGPKWFTYIAEELPQYIYSHFPISDKREDNFACGMSMGGYGAYKLGLTYPERYGAIASIANGLGLLDVVIAGNLEKEFDKSMTSVFGQDKTVLRGSSLDPYALVEKLLKEGKEFPKMLMACGTEDFTYNDNVKFIKYLESVGLKPDWMQSPGIHGWDSWNEYIPKVIKWLPIHSK